MKIVIETFKNIGEPSSKRVRVRPASGQLNGEYKIWCSVSQREFYPIGSLFIVEATWVTPSNRKSFLRISPKDDWQLITTEHAKKFVDGMLRLA